MATPVYTALINGVDRAASNVLLEGLSIREVTNGVNTFVCKVESANTSPLLRPQKRQEVVITEDGIPIFGGVIRGARESSFGGSSADGYDAIVTEIECDDFGQYFQRRFLDFTFAGGTLKAFAVAFTAFFSAAPFSITLDPSQVDGPTIEAMVWETERGDDILNFVAALTAKTGAPFQWKVGYNKVWGFYQASIAPAPWDVIEANFQTEPNKSTTGDIVSEPTDDTYANKIWGIFGSGKVVSTSDTFATNGVLNSFQITMNVVGPQPPDLSVPSTIAFAVIDTSYGTGTESIGVTGTPGVVWWYAPATRLISRQIGGPPPAGTITLRYNGQLKLVLFAQNAGEIATNGLWEDKIVDEDVEDEVLGQAVVDAELARRLVQAKIVKYQSRRVPGPKPGQSQTITSPKRNLSGTFTIVDVATEYEAGSDVLIRTVTASSSVYEHWRQTLTRWWSPNEAGRGQMPVGSSAFPGPPVYSAQWNNFGTFGGAYHILYGDLFWDQPDALHGEVRTKGWLFVTNQAMGAAGHIGLTDPQRLEMGMLGSGDFSMDMFSPSGSEASILINATGEVIITAGTPIVSPMYLGGVHLVGHESITERLARSSGIVPGVSTLPGAIGDSFSRFGRLNVLDGIAVAYRTVSSLPFSIQVTGTETSNEFTTYVVTAGTGTINLPWIGSAGTPNYRSFPITLVGRVYGIINDGGGTLTVNAGAAGTNINDAASITLADKASIIVERHDDGWRIVAGFGTITGGGAGSGATPGGSNTQVQFNDSGVFGGDAQLTWAKTLDQLTVSRDLAANNTTLRVRDDAGLAAMIGISSFHNERYSDIVFGWERVANVETARTHAPAYIYFQNGSVLSPPLPDQIGFEINPGETAGNPMAFGLGRGFAVNASGLASIYQYGGLGTGAVSGPGLQIDANLSGSGSASYVSLQTRTGTRYYVWFDNSGVPRYSTAPPQEDGTPSDTSGTLFGTAAPPFALLTADPGSPANDTWWAVRENTSPMSVSVKARIGGVTYTIASITV